MSFRVDFVIIGAMKSGTTDLAKRLASHSQVDFSKRKEPHFFSDTADWASRLDEYHRLFSPRPGQICGEASTSYSFLAEYPEVAERLHSYNPDLQILYIVRDPIERIRSHYAHRLMHGIAEKDPRSEIRNRKMQYLNRSQYGNTMKEYLKHFRRNQILVIKFEEYVQNQSEVFRRVCEHLGISVETAETVSAKNKSTGSNRLRFSPIYYIDHLLAYSPPLLRRQLSKYISVKLRRKPVLPQDLQSELRRDLEPDISLFEVLSGIDTSSWRAATANRPS